MADPIVVPFLSWMSFEPETGPLLTGQINDMSEISFEYMPLDVVYKVQPSHTGISTDSPVQQGINVTDNARRQPVTLQLEFAIADMDGSKKGLAAYDTLVKLQKDATMVKFVQARTWDNMFIESIDIPDTLEPIMGRIRFAVKLKEILLTTITVTPPKARPVSARKPKQLGHKDTWGDTRVMGDRPAGYADWSDLYSKYYVDEPAQEVAENPWWYRLISPNVTATYGQ